MMQFNDKYNNRISGTWNGITVRIPKTWGGHTFTNDEVAALFSGKSIDVDFTTKSGRRSSATLYISDKATKPDGSIFTGIKADFHGSSNKSKTSNNNTNSSSGSQPSQAGQYSSNNDQFTVSMNGRTITLEKTQFGHYLTDDEICIITNNGIVIVNQDNEIMALKMYQTAFYDAEIRKIDLEQLKAI